MQNRVQNRIGDAAARLNIPNHPQYDAYDFERIRQRMRDERQEVNNIVNEFIDRRRFQNADGPEFNEAAGDDPDENAADGNVDAAFPNLIQPIPHNMFENNRMINVGDRRAGDFGRVRINGDIVRPGVAGANAAAAQDDNNSDNNSNGTVFSDIPEEDGFSFAN